MVKFFLVAILSLTSYAKTSSASPPQVTTDIAPVFGLVAQVMQGVGTPSLIIRPGSDAHHYNLRPSEAENIQKADAIFWIGTELTPWLETALTNLAVNAKKISLLDTPDITILETGKPGHHHSGSPQHINDDHDKHHDHDKHDEQNLIDAHAWLDPENARIWLKVIAEELSLLNPENSEIYKTNATKAANTVIDLENRIRKILASPNMPPVFVQHAAFAYFENYFNFELAGALYDRENEPPSATHISKLHELTKNTAKACLLAESSIENNVIASVFEHTDLLVQEVNPSGVRGSVSNLAYFELLTALADSLQNCAQH